MPRKIKIINENIEEVESLEKTPPEPEKVKKPRTEKQIQAFKNMIEGRKKKPLEVPKEIELPKKVEIVKQEEPEEEQEYINEIIRHEAPKRKRGRPQLTPEKIELKQSMRELELQRQLEKLEKKIESTAKQEAKKKVLSKIKQKLEEDNDVGNSSDSDDDDAINQIVAKHKKPIVIVNKIERDPKKKKPTYEQPQPMAYFI